MRLRRWWDTLRSLLSGADERADLAVASHGVSPSSALQLLLEATAHQKDGQTTAAVESFVKAATRFRDVGKVPQARAALKLALRLHPFDPVLRLELLVLESEGQPVEIGEAVGSPLADGPEEPTRRLTRAEWRSFFEAQGPFGLVADGFTEASPTRSLRAPLLRG